LKVIIFLLFLFLISVGFVWFDENSGLVTINWFDYQIEFSTTFLVASTIFLVLALYIIISLILGVFNLPKLFKNAFGGSEKQKIKLFEDGFAALLSADYNAASKTSEKLLKSTGKDDKYKKLALILSSKTAQESGNLQVANERFRLLANYDSTKYFATRGLLQSSFNEGNIDGAITHAEQAYRLNPTVTDGAKSLLELYKKAGKWSEAEKFIANNKRNHFFGGDAKLDTKKELAEVKFLYARELLLTADGRKAYIDLAIDNLLAALKLVPSQEEAVLILIKLCEDNKRTDEAKLAVENFWKLKTNYEIGKKYIENLSIYDPSKRSELMKKSAKKLQKLNPESEISQQLLEKYNF
jgi:HemY protein